jgi:hypothetical protein
VDMKNVHAPDGIDQAPPKDEDAFTNNLISKLP